MRIEKIYGKGERLRAGGQEFRTSAFIEGWRLTVGDERACVAWLADEELIPSGQSLQGPSHRVRAQLVRYFAPCVTVFLSTRLLILQARLQGARLFRFRSRSSYYHFF